MLNSEIIVTGAASGIGASVAAILESQQRHVMKVDAVAAKGVHQMDVTDPWAWDALIQYSPNVTGLVNSAGIKRPAALMDLDIDDFQRVLEVNVLGSLYGVRALAKHWVKQGVPGSIVNVGSIVADRTPANQVAYNTSKGALRSMTKSVAVELAPHGIRANLIAPGSVSTPFTAERWAITEHAEQMRHKIPMSRGGDPTEIASVVSFLLSDAASYVTGAAWSIDGGWSASAV